MTTPLPSTSKNTRVKLSCSSMKLLQSCEQRYHHYKVSNSPKDSDYTESDSLGVGKAFHQVLEKTLHNSWNSTLLLSSMSDHAVDSDDYELLEVMLEKYVSYRKLSGIKIVKCEFGIETNMYVGFVDAIAIDPISKKWWIIDLKTSARHDPNLIPQLSKDLQVGLYSYFAPDIEIHIPETQGFNFGGFKYCQVIKSKAATRSGLEKAVKVVEMTIPISIINTEDTWSLFNHVHDRAMELHAGEDPRKNYSACFTYFSPCPYFSKCHGNNFTMPNTDIIVSTIDTYKDGDLL